MPILRQFGLFLRKIDKPPSQFDSTCAECETPEDRKASILL